MSGQFIQKSLSVLLVALISWKATWITAALLMPLLVWFHVVYRVFLSAGGQRDGQIHMKNATICSNFGALFLSEKIAQAERSTEY